MLAYYHYQQHNSNNNNNNNNNSLLTSSLRGKQNEKKTWSWREGTKRHPKLRRSLAATTCTSLLFSPSTPPLLSSTSPLLPVNIIIINNLDINPPVPLPEGVSDLKMVEGRRDRGGLLPANSISVSCRSRRRAKEVCQEACRRLRGRLVDLGGDSGNCSANGLGGFVVFVGD